MSHLLRLLLILCVFLLNAAAASEIRRLARAETAWAVVQPSGRAEVQHSGDSSDSLLERLDEVARQTDVIADTKDNGVVVTLAENVRERGHVMLDVGASAVAGYGLKLHSRRDGQCQHGGQAVFPVDIVIPCSSPDDATLLNEETMSARDRDNDELTYTLRAIAKNAPWVRRIFLLVNGHPDMSSKIAEPNKTEVVDRCQLLPGGLCTRNSFVAASIVHKIRGLSEHFIYSEDDDLLCQPACVADFFDVLTAQPRVFGTAEFKDLYDFPENTGLGQDEIPRTTNAYAHTWNPMTKSALNDLETAYPKWLSFLRSHRLGRYSSKFNESDTPASEDANSCEEMLASGVWWWWLKMTDGEYSDDMRFRDTHRSEVGYDLSSYDTYTWNQLKTNPPFLQNINDDMDDTGMFSSYETQHAVMIETLEAMFPAFPSMAEEADAKAEASCRWPRPLCFAMGW